MIRVPAFHVKQKVTLFHVKLLNFLPPHFIVIVAVVALCVSDGLAAHCAIPGVEQLVARGNRHRCGTCY